VVVSDDDPELLGHDSARCMRAACQCSAEFAASSRVRRLFLEALASESHANPERFDPAGRLQCLRPSRMRFASTAEAAPLAAGMKDCRHFSCLARQLRMRLAMNQNEGAIDRVGRIALGLGLLALTVIGPAPSCRGYRSI
jgi:hypothetical protein